MSKRARPTKNEGDPFVDFVSARQFQGPLCQFEEVHILSVGSRSLVAVPAFSQKRACQQSKATPYTEFPPKLSSLHQFRIQCIPHRFAGVLRFRNILVVGALNLFQSLHVLGSSMQISLRETSETGISLFLSIEGTLNFYFGHCVRRRPLQGGTYEYCRQPNPAGENGVGQKSMQVHASHLLPGTSSRGMK